MKGNRRQAREDAVQILYQLDLNEDLTPKAGLEHFAKLYSEEGTGVDSFTERLVLGVAENLKEINATLKAVSEHWRPERMPAVDRNILRLGVYELCYCDDIPSTVSINEMIEIAKHFGSDNSASFINGVLDKVREKNPRSNKAP